ncbi:MAG: ABC transporter permease [Candidatus Izemoplasmataceae bacterium]
MDLLYYLIPLFIASAVPLAVVALGGLFSERSGVVNIALEGIMIMGGFVGIMFIRFLENTTDLPTQLIALSGLLVGLLTGVVFSVAHAYASINMKANQIISATALNMFAPAVAIFTARMLWQTDRVVISGNYRISSIPLLGDIPIIGPLFFQSTYLSTFIGIALFIGATIVLYKTRLGLRLRSCGENPHASDSVGISVLKMRYIGVLVSGAMAGMGGVIFVLSFATRFDANVAGFGFLSLAVMISGQWKPKRIVIVAIFFASMRVIASAYGGIPGLRGLPISPDIYRMLPYIATLVVLAFTSKYSQAPAAVGEPYDVSKR